MVESIAWEFYCYRKPKKSKKSGDINKKFKTEKCRNSNLINTYQYFNLKNIYLIFSRYKLRKAEMIAIAKSSEKNMYIYAI